MCSFSTRDANVISRKVNLKTRMLHNQRRKGTRKRHDLSPCGAASRKNRTLQIGYFRGGETIIPIPTELLKYDYANDTQTHANDLLSLKRAKPRM